MGVKSSDAGAAGVSGSPRSPRRTRRGSAAATRWRTRRAWRAPSYPRPVGDDAPDGGDAGGRARLARGGAAAVLSGEPAVRALLFAAAGRGLPAASQKRARGPRADAVAKALGNAKVVRDRRRPPPRGMVRPGDRHRPVRACRAWTPSPPRRGEAEHTVVIASRGRSGVRDARRRLGGEVGRPDAVRPSRRAPGRDPCRAAVAYEADDLRPRAAARRSPTPWSRRSASSAMSRVVGAATRSARASTSPGTPTGRSAGASSIPATASSSPAPTAPSTPSPPHRCPPRARTARSSSSRTPTRSRAGRRVPARHPAGVQQGSGARRLQSRLDRRRRPGDLGGGAGAHRPAPRDHPRHPPRRLTELTENVRGRAPHPPHRRPSGHPRRRPPAHGRLDAPLRAADPQPHRAADRRPARR